MKVKLLRKIRKRYFIENGPGFYILFGIKAPSEVKFIDNLDDAINYMIQNTAPWWYLLYKALTK